MVDIRDTELGGVNLMYNAINRSEHFLQNSGFIFPFPTTTIGAAVAANKKIIEIVFRLPCRILNHIINVGAIRARRLSKLTGSCALERHARGKRFINMFFDKVHLQRFISFGSLFDQPVKLIHEQPESVAKNRAELHEHVNTRTAELLKRHETVVADFAKRIVSRFSTKQPDHHSHRFAFGLDGIETPEHLGYGFGILSTALFEMLGDDALCNERTTLEGEHRRDSPRIN